MPDVNPEELVPAGSALEPIPQVVTLKDGFVERYKELLGDRYEAFLQHSLSYARKAVRANTLKIPVDDLKARLSEQWDLTPVPWCSEGFWLSFRDGDRYDIGNLPEHQLGYLYVQGAASMIPALVLQPQPGETVLDLCASPGSKTTQLAAMMENTGVLVANDVSGGRMKPLGLNTQRCGVMNAMLVFRANKRLPRAFDRVLVDAPCSATGTVRNSLKALEMWSPGFVKRMAHTQRGILEDAWKALKPGGVLVYSTCSLEPEENEGNVTTFLEHHPDAVLEDIELDINRSPAVKEFDGRQYHPDVEKCLRIWPQDNDTEGFFVARFRKTTSAPSRSSPS